MLCAAWLNVVPLDLRAEEEFTFDASEYEKRSFDFRGYAEFWPEYIPSNRDGALYQLAFFGEDPEDNISRTTAVLDLEGRYNRDILTFFFRTHSDIRWDYNGEEQEHELYEGVLSAQPSTGLTLEAGKKATRWGKGVFWNPVGFVERIKDPNDPDLSRQGFWMAGADWVRSFDGPLQTVSFTPLAVPTFDGLNEDFGDPGHLNFAGKLYVLYRDTDLDFLFLTRGSRTPRIGFDFSKNLAPNFEVHGEFAYISDFERIKVTPAPACRATNAGAEDVISYLLGLRYRTERDITYTLEYYFDGTGNTPEQQRRYYDCVHTAWDEDDAATMGRLRSPQLSRRFVRPNPMRKYLGFRAAWNEPFDILYFTPGLQAFYNLEDNSFQLAPELNYTGFGNFEFRMRGTVPIGSTVTEWGEKANEYKIDLRMRYYF
jgi:hypothetical protein